MAQECNTGSGTLTAIGLISGTSMDGVDAALIVTDGERMERFGATCYRPYSAEERALLREALVVARTLEDRSARPGPLAQAEAMVTRTHGEAVEELIRQAGLARPAIDVVGFHGQTVFHAPERRLTVQLGDGAALARRLGITVVYDFRAADVAAGGEGAPLVPVFHRALVEAAGLEPPVAVLNLGGVANLTLIERGGGLTAFDCGPASALIDDLVRSRLGIAMDEDGRIAAAGRPDYRLVAAALAHPFFERPPPKSLDRDAFALPGLKDLSTEDAAATLVAFTAEGVARGLAFGRERPATLIIAGGGARNPVLVAAIGAACRLAPVLAEDIGWSGDFLEAQAFAYLAVRRLRGLPASFPGTTGVPAATPGGVIARPA